MGTGKCSLWAEESGNWAPGSQRSHSWAHSHSQPTIHSPGFSFPSIHGHRSSWHRGLWKLTYTCPHPPAVLQDIQEVEGEDPQPQQEPPVPGRKAGPAAASGSHSGPSGEAWGSWKARLAEGGSLVFIGAQRRRLTNWPAFCLEPQTELRAFYCTKWLRRVSSWR